MSERGFRSANAPRVADNRQFYSRRQPDVVARVPFEQQRQQMLEVSRRTFSSTPGRSAAADPGREVVPRGTPERPASSRSADGWSRFGSASGGPSPSVSGSASPAVESGRAAPDSGRGWRQLGESPSRGSTGPAERQVVPADRSMPAPSANWRRFGEPSRGGNTIEPPAVRSEQALPRSEVPNRGARPAEAPGRFENNTSQRFAEPVRINPPIVRERSGPTPAARFETPRPDFSGNRGSAGGGSAPRVSAPPSGGGGSHASAPAASHGGGGGERSGGGGGHRR
jgi:hypothetical protein